MPDHCETCRHWVRPDGDRPFGLCVRPIMPGALMSVGAEDPQDGGDLEGTLVTSPDFGCAQHERSGDA